MGGIVQQLGLDPTIVIQFAIIWLTFAALGKFYFQPFLKLIHARHKRLIEDREAAEKLVIQADAKFEEYKKKLGEERMAARQEYEALLTQAKKEEAQILGQARSEAKRITQEAAESAQAQRDRIQAQLNADIEGIAQQITDTLLLKRS